MKASTVILALLSAVVSVQASPEASPEAAPRGATSQARATLATVYSACTVPKTVALTFDDGPYLYL